MAEKRKKFSAYFYNPVTYTGVALSLFIFFIEVFLFGIDFVRSSHNVYLGLFTYIIIPPFFAVGMVLIPSGALWTKHRILMGQAEDYHKKFHIDLSNPAHFNGVLIFIVGTFIFSMMSLVGAYQAFHYSESTRFCGNLCHSVMSPEYATYQKSPHGQIKCVECHIGSGADWYVRSKLSGLRQVFRTALASYEQPIKTPIKDLRPAQETCKQCHWPGKFFGTMDFKRWYYLSEGQHPKWYLRMLLNVGGGEHQSYGVHAHMNIDQDIFFANEDERKQEIAWVKTLDKQNREIIYTREGSPWKNAAPPDAKIHKMDCIDCHNRPSHQFRPPYFLLNNAMQYGDVDEKIPNIKTKGMEALSQTYPNTAEAISGIRQSLTGYYSDLKGFAYDQNKAAVDKAIEKMIEIYRENFFPEMSARWDTHPDNIGHLYSPGCFRCHNDKLTSPEGKTISKDCNICHLFVEQGFQGKISKNIEGLEFQHPVDIGDSWKDTLCNECHTGGI